MPESEPKPRLIELVDPGAGQGWKAVLKNGKSVVVHEIPVPAVEAAGAVPRIQRLFEHRHPALSPVLAWGTDPNGLWVAVEPHEGVPLGTILSRGPLTPPAAAALGASLLSGVAALHEAGIAMGGFGAAAVRVTGNGEVRLAGHPAGAVRGAPSQSDLRADVRSSGMAICAAFGVDPAGAPAPPNIPPGLVVTMRSMASGAMGPAADRAQGALREMASALLAPDRMTAAQAELATRAGGREMPSITPFLPKTEAPAPAPAPTGTYTPPPRDETPLPAAASYEPPPRAPEPQAPSQEAIPWAPYTTTPPVAPAEPEPPPTPLVTSPPPAAPEPPGSTPPEPSPFATGAPPSWDTPAAVETPQEAPPSPAPAATEWDPVPAPMPPILRQQEAAEPAAAPAHTSSAQQTWTPVATPAWTPGGEPAATAPTVTAAPEAATSTVPPSAPARQPSVARPSDREPGERPGWLVPAIIAVVLLLLIGAGTGIYLATRPGNSTAQVTPTPTSTSKTSPKVSPKASPTAGGTGPQAVPTYAPASAAPVTSVAFCIASTHPCAGVRASEYTSCKINGPCRVMVELKFSSPQRGTVGFMLKFFDRCTGMTTDLPGNSFVPPGYTRVDLLKVVSLPTGAKSAALVAVSTSPAAAASTPLLLGSSDTC